MITTQPRPAAQNITQVIGYSGCVEWSSWLPNLNPLNFFVWRYKECMQPFHQHCGNFEIEFRTLVPACYVAKSAVRNANPCPMCIVAEEHHFENDR
ncbi:hypothetical protein TNCV_212481 [Trichonephila clavipes]|nr:hypothetical protein TNCV_212481 [Trichonephila clavipes]